MKVVMKCVFCDFSAKWYENQWQEVFEYKSKNGDYVCTECFNERAIKQIKKELELKKRKK